MSAHDALSRTKRDLGKRRDREADVNYRFYVGPYGDSGLHRVKRSGQGMVYVVAGPNRTFRPGEIVPTGSNVGRQGEVILVEPPPGRRGNPTFPGTTPPVVQPPAGFTVFANGELGITTVVNPTIFSVTEVGAGPFSASNWLELSDPRDDNDASIDPSGVFLIQSSLYVDEGEWNFTVWTLAAQDYTFKIRIWDKHPSQGGTTWKEQPDDPDDFYANRYRIIAL